MLHAKLITCDYYCVLLVLYAIVYFWILHCLL